jgi:hypothetical protein
MLPDFIQTWVVCWLFLGIPSVAIIFGLSHLPIFRRWRTRAVLWRLPLLGLLFGLATGYFEAWTYRHDLRQPERWYEVLAIPGVPGDGMANSYGGDWQDDEAWDYRSDIALWNGLFWVTVTAFGAIVVYFTVPRGGTPETSAPDKSPEPAVVPSARRMPRSAAL